MINGVTSLTNIVQVGFQQILILLRFLFRLSRRLGNDWCLIRGIRTLFVNLDLDVNYRLLFFVLSCVDRVGVLLLLG